MSRPYHKDLDLMSLYPVDIRRLDRVHWSPLPVIYESVRFLAEKEETAILDIGSGAGKFCLAGSYLRPNATFYGVEQRSALVDQANQVKEFLDRPNVRFIHKDFTQLDLRAFDHFYFYNSFFENLPGSDKIDDSMEYSAELYHYYSQYLSKQLEGMDTGTKVVTYCSWDDEIPPGYFLMETKMEGLLKFWLKV